MIVKNFKFYIIYFMEIILVRIIPGAINIATIITLGHILSPTTYGYFSTVLATCVAFSNFLFGIINYSVVPNYAIYEIKNKTKLFNSFLIGFCLIVSIISIIFSIIFDFFGFFIIPYSLLVVVMGCFASFQSTLRARLKFRRYGVAAMIQATSIYVLVNVFVDPTYQIYNIFYIYISGYATGLIASLCLFGFIKPSISMDNDIISSLKIGLNLTLSNIAENSLQLGFRYSLLLFAPPHILGIFSFSLDIAQRFIGVILNITSFALIPHIFRKYAENDSRGSIRLMLVGSLSSGLLATIVLIFTIIISNYDFFDILDDYLFSRYAFFFVSVAVIVNRIKKMSVDAVAINNNNSNIIKISYFVFSPLAFAANCLLIFFKFENFTFPLYAFIYTSIFAFTAFFAICTKPKVQTHL